NRPAALASTTKRCLYSSSASGPKPERHIVLMATFRSIFGSRARYTTPIAPRPSSSSISYRPKLVPTRVAMVFLLNRAAYAGEYIAPVRTNQSDRADRDCQNDSEHYAYSATSCPSSCRHTLQRESVNSIPSSRHYTGNRRP